MNESSELAGIAKKVTKKLTKSECLETARKMERVAEIIRQRVWGISEPISKQLWRQPPPQLFFEN